MFEKVVQQQRGKWGGLRVFVRKLVRNRGDVWESQPCTRLLLPRRCAGISLVGGWTHLGSKFIAVHLQGMSAS